MKLLGIFRFELAYQARRPWPWLIFTALVAFSFLFTRDGSLSEVQYADFYLNSPFLIAGGTVFGCVLWLMMAAAVAGEAAARDVAVGMYPLTYTAPVSKTEYLGGRFLAALALNALLVLAITVGNLLGVYLPGVHPDAVGPFRPAAYLTAYLFIALPNAFVATAVQFSLATRSGRPMAAYLGSFLLFFTGFFVAALLLFRRGLGTLLDPIGIRFIIEDIAHLWTTVEKNERLLELEGIVLHNRLVWLGVGVGVLAITYLSFRFAHRTESSGWRNWRRPFGKLRAGPAGAYAPMPAGIGVTARAGISVPQVARAFGFALHARQTVAIAWDSMRTIAKSWAGLALLVGVPPLTCLVVLDQMFSYGGPLVPTTGQVLKELTAPLADELSRWVIVPLLIVFFAGELLWRERDAGLSEITDATPVPEWVPLLGKFVGLGLVLAVFMALLMASGMLAQVILGHDNFEIGLYLKILFGLQLPEYLLFAVLAFVLHVLVNQKYIGHFVAVLAYVLLALAPMFGVEHKLLLFGAGPRWTYTQMRGLGPYVWPWLWFKLYWAAWAMLLAVVARLLWGRGRESGLRERLQLARQRLTRGTLAAAAAAVGLIFGLGGFIFYNTNVRNEYVSSSRAVERSADYERRYGRYAGIPQPQLTGTQLHVEIYPERREVEIRGSYHLVNRSAVAIASVHVVTARPVASDALVFDPPAALELYDERLGQRIYTLATPLQPGDSLQLAFRVHVEPHGFRESGADTSVVANGTIITNGWLPAIGYQKRRELTSASERRKQGLAPRPVIPSLYDVEARNEGSTGVAFDAVVSTRPDQIAVAPGALRRTWTEGGRRYFHYSTDGPIGEEWVIASAVYAVHEAQWGQVAIRIFHHPGHTGHVDRMIRSIQASLDYDTAQIGPYPYHHLTAVEVPGDGVGIHADASMLTHGEGITLMQPTDDPRRFDLPFAIAAHEIAHQWAVPYAFVEGAPVLSESLAWYYAIKVVESARGPEQLRQLLRFMRQPYPIAPIRRGEPLLRGLDPWMSYRKGPYALYALSEYIGTEQVNGALRRLWEKHPVEGGPLATTLDLYRELQAVTPGSLQHLLHDLFEVNTIWELETERASAEQLGESAWQVTLDVRARKVVCDEAGVETEPPMDEWLPIGIFAPGGEGGELSKPLHLQNARIRSGRQTITVMVAAKPALAGIDPYHLLDWEQHGDDDNIEEVEIAE